jgi:YggT family protein
MSHLIAGLIANMISVYTLLILAAVLFSWMRRPRSNTLGGIRRGVELLTLPYLRLFRRIVPPLGRIDLSPMVALVALQVLGGATAATVAQL